jgi:hypothetical protein
LFSRATVFIRDEKAHVRAGTFGSAAADADDASGARFAHVREDGSQDVERAREIHVEHALEGGVVGVGNGLASGESADRVGEHVDLAEAGDD